MREILFRGQAKNDTYRKDGDWIYSSFIMQDPKTELLSHQVELFDGSRWVAIDPETVGQYTGLTDKNGTKIFEGDIVKVECDLYHGENKKERVTRIGTVIYDKKFCQFGINVARFSKCHILNRWKGDYNEVIGNIHDNPELLKGDAK